jgi:hypothetical protein
MSVHDKGIELYQTAGPGHGAPLHRPIESEGKNHTRLLFKLAQARMACESETASALDVLRRPFLGRHLGRGSGPSALR